MSSQNLPTGDVYIGLDVGTQGTKALLYHPDTFVVLARASVSYDLAPNPQNVAGRAEQDPTVWVSAVRTVLKDLAGQHDLSGEGNLKVRGIGVSGQQHGMVPLDSCYKPIRLAKLWCDVEASAQAKTFSQKATETMGKDWTIPPGFTAPKVLWLKENEPENFAKMAWCVLPHDYITFLLCGGGMGRGIDPTTDAGDASGTGVFDPATRAFNEQLADCVDAKYYSTLPKCLPPSAIAGHLSCDWKTEFKMDSNNKEQIVISVGSGDNMCSSLGAGCVLPGAAVMSLGTSGTIFGVSEAPVVTGTPVACFCDATGRHLPLVCTMSCTGVLNSVLESFCEGMSHEEATKAAGWVEAGCYGLTFLPFLGGERTPNWPSATGSLMGLTSSNMKELSLNRPGIMYRAAMEGVTYLLAEALESMRVACEDGFNPQSLLVVGGGSKNELWRQMIADVLDLDLRFPREAETAALGAAFQAGAASKGVDISEYVLRQCIDLEDFVVKPSQDKAVTGLYKDALARYKGLLNKLYDDAV